MIMTMLLIL